MGKVKNTTIINHRKQELFAENIIHYGNVVAALGKMGAMIESTGGQ